MSTSCHQISTPYRLVVSEYKVHKVFVCESRKFFCSTLYYIVCWCWLSTKQRYFVVLLFQVKDGLSLPTNEDCPVSSLFREFHHTNNNLTMTVSKDKNQALLRLVARGHAREVTRQERYTSRRDWPKRRLKIINSDDEERNWSKSWDIWQKWNDRWLRHCEDAKQYFAVIEIHI